MSKKNEKVRVEEAGSGKEQKERRVEEESKKNEQVRAEDVGSRKAQEEMRVEEMSENEKVKEGREEKQKAGTGEKSKGKREKHCSPSPGPPQ